LLVSVIPIEASEHAYFQDEDVDYNIEYERSAKIKNLCNSIAFDLYRKLKKEDSEDDIVVSPVSYLSALGMVYLASDERGRVGLSVEYGLSDIQPEDFEAFYRQMYRSVDIYRGIIGDDDYAFRFDLINSVWALQPGIAERFGGVLGWPVDLNLHPLYYQGSTMTAVGRINEWFSQRTGLSKHRIIDENEISSEVSAITANSVNLSAVWHSIVYGEKYLSSDLFHGLISDRNVEMMRTLGYPADMLVTSFMQYTESEDYQALYMPFRYFQRPLGFGAVFILPKEENGLAKIEEKLDASFLEQIMSDLRPFRERFNLDMKLPCFIISGKNFVEEVSAVQSNDKMFTCKVVSPAYVEISETGVKTFNTYQFGMLFGYGPLPELIRQYKTNEPLSFHATRPFLFCIVLNIDHKQEFYRQEKPGERPRLDTILFIGRYTGPKN
jgi:serine protease inhibitor